MPNLTNLSVDILVLILRFAVVLLLYFFLWQVLRFVMRDLRAGGQPSNNGAGGSPTLPGSSGTRRCRRTSGVPSTARLPASYRRTSARR